MDATRSERDINSFRPSNCVDVTVELLAPFPPGTINVWHAVISLNDIAGVMRRPASHRTAFSLHQSFSCNLTVAGNPI